MTPIRCTQNPTMGEEWRKGWHPERVPPRSGDDAFLIVGAGPRGLECARLLGRRGHAVHLVEAGERARRTRDARVAPAWARRMGAGSRLSGGPTEQNGRGRDSSRQPGNRGAHPGVRREARGARDRRTLAPRRRRQGQRTPHPAASIWRAQVFTPDDVMDGSTPRGPAVVFDDDHYYMGGVLAEKLRALGLEVTLVTPADRVSAWTVNTLEQYAIQKRLLEFGVAIIANHNLAAFDGDSSATSNAYSPVAASSVPAGSIVTRDLAAAER